MIHLKFTDMRHFKVAKFLAISGILILALTALFNYDGSGLHFDSSSQGWWSAGWFILKVSAVVYLYPLMKLYQRAVKRMEDDKRIDND